MIDEVGLKRMEKRLDTLDSLIEQYIKAGQHVPDEIRTERKELVDKHNEVVTVLKKKAVYDFMRAIQDEKLPDTMEEMPKK